MHCSLLCANQESVPLVLVKRDKAAGSPADSIVVVCIQYGNLSLMKEDSSIDETLCHEGVKPPIDLLNLKILSSWQRSDQFLANKEEDMQHNMPGLILRMKSMTFGLSFEFQSEFCIILISIGNYCRSDQSQIPMFRFYHNHSN